MSKSQNNPNNKGLKRNAISFLSNVVIGVSSTSPAYSLAATLGPIAGFAAFGIPSIMIVAFIPMLFIATACYQMNRADPDCGTTFSWVTRAMGPHLGWMGGWSVIVADILVMPSLAAIAGRYSFRLFGASDPSSFEVTLIGVAWIAIMTAICYVGIELSARTQQLLLGTELAILVTFATVALTKVYVDNPPASSRHVLFSWFNPFAVGDFTRFTEAIVLAVFIYWGWDSCVAVNEETERPESAPGCAAIVSTIVLVGIYALVAVATVALSGPDFLIKNKDNVLPLIGQSVLGSPLDKILILAVLTSAVASTQTTILPTARIVLSMAHARAIPRCFGVVHPRYLSPGFATLTMGAVSIVWYVGLTVLSADVLTDSITAVGLVVAFYYGLTGLACATFYRRALFRSVRNFVSMGAIPAAGGLIMFVLLIKACFYPGEANASQISVFGIGGPVLISTGALIAGLVLMAFAQRRLPNFFRRNPEIADSVRIASAKVGDSN